MPRPRPSDPRHPRKALGASGRAGRAGADDRVHALARGRARPALRRLRRALALVGRRPGGLLGLDLGLLRRAGRRRRLRPVLASREMPGAEWFAGTQPQLRRARLRGKDDAETGDPARLRAARARRAQLGRAARPGRRGRRRPARARGRARRPRRRLPAEHPRGDRRLPRHRLARRRLVELLARLRPGQRRSTASPRSSPRSSSPSTATATAARTSTAARRSPRCRRRCRACERTVVLPYLDPDPDLSALRRRRPAGTSCSPPARAPSSASSASPSTTRSGSSTPPARPGLPKAIVQGQGGILLEHLKKLHLHVDAHPGDRLFWFTTTGWMMWNFLVSGLLTRAAIVLYDGNPGHPDMSVLWDLAERAGVTMFGTSASYIAACMKAGVEPGAGRDLSRLRAVGSTGSPLSPEGFDWIYEHARRRHLALLDQRRHRRLHRLRRRRRRCCRSTAASCRRGRWAPRSRPGTKTATR